MERFAPSPPGIVTRSGPRPGDVQRILEAHATLYAAEYGFDPTTFGDHVRGPLEEFAARHTPGADAAERLWVAERGDALVGCIAIVRAAPAVAQLRWFLVAPQARGRGLGSALLRRAIAFSRRAGYASIQLWTVDRLEAAARRYVRAGFRIEEAAPRRLWGLDLVEQRYVLPLRGSADG